MTIYESVTLELIEEEERERQAIKKFNESYNAKLQAIIEEDDIF